MVGKTPDGILVRCIDIEAKMSDFGIFENLGKFKNGNDLSCHLKTKTNEIYGLVAEEFVNNLPDEFKIKDDYTKSKESLRKNS